MTTAVSAERLGSRVEVTGTTVHVPAETGFHTLFIEDRETKGRVWLQLSIRNVVLPIPLSPFIDIVEVDKLSGEKQIWTGNEFRRISFT